MSEKNEEQLFGLPSDSWKSIKDTYLTITGVAVLLGAALILVKCAEIGFLPEFDISKIASLLLGIFCFGVICFGLLLIANIVPGLFLREAFKYPDASQQRRRGGALFFILTLVLALTGSSLWNSSLFLLIAGVVIIMVGVVLRVYIIPKYITTIPSEKRLPYVAYFLFGIIVAVTTLVIIFSFIPSNASDFITKRLLVAVFAILSNIAWAFTTMRERLIFVAVVFCWISSTISGGCMKTFGLGERYLQKLEVKSEYALLLGDFHPKAKDKGEDKDKDWMILEGVYLKLRIGNQIAIGLKNPGHDARTYVLPNDAVRGMVLEKPDYKLPKDAESTNDSKAGSSASPSPSVAVKSVSGAVENSAESNKP